MAKKWVAEEVQMKETIGFIGLGDLGLPIARNLLAAGYALKVYNRTASKAEPLVTRGAQQVFQPRDVLTRGGIVVSVVWDDAALESIVISEGFLEQLGPGGIHLSMSTIAPAAAQKLAAMHAEQECSYLEAPVFGRHEAAVARQLWICLAGPAVPKERVRPLLETTSQGIFDFGEHIGAASLVKISGNFLGAAAIQAMIEVLSLAKKSGNDPKKVIAENPEYFADRSRGPIALKDITLFEETASQVDLQAPLAHLIHNVLSNAKN
jgi:3-hydroxyisobutyrate dehydrogenase-like beta-hydroxyacid dehydrogenase